MTTPECGTCQGTGEVWAAGEDGVPFSSGCPDCDTPHPEAQAARLRSRIMREAHYLNESRDA